MTTTIESTITFPYKRSLGPVLGAFMTALRDRRIIGIRNGSSVLCPPLEWDPRTEPVSPTNSWKWARPGRSRVGVGFPRPVHSIR